MTDIDDEGGFKSVLAGIKMGIGLSLAYLVYRFLRPYYYAIRLQHWLQVEPDYIEDYSRSFHLFGFYEYELELTGDDDSELVIENKSRRVPVIIRAKRDFDPRVLSNLQARRPNEDEEIPYTGEMDFFSQVHWALNGAPGVYNFIDSDGERCGPDESRGVVVEYRIYPDSVSQHEIINAIVEVASAMKMIRQFEGEYMDRIDQLR